MIVDEYNFIWRDQAGNEWKLKDMRTSHLFFCIRMIYNHTVPPQMRLIGGRYEDVEKWDNDYKVVAVTMLTKELVKRKPLPEWMLQQIHVMDNNIKKIKKISN